MAETVFRHVVAKAGYAGSITVISAGTGDWHVGENSDERTLAALARARLRRLVAPRQAVRPRLVRQPRPRRGLRPRPGTHPAAWANNDADRGKVALLLSFDKDQAALTRRSRPVLFRRGAVRDRARDDREGEHRAVPSNQTRNPTESVMTALPEQPLSPLDGRYRSAVSRLGDQLSEAGAQPRAGARRGGVADLPDRSLALRRRARCREARRGAEGARHRTSARPRSTQLASSRPTTRHDVKAVEYSRARQAGRSGPRRASPSSRTSAARARTSTTSPTRSRSARPCARCGCPSCTG